MSCSSSTLANPCGAPIQPHALGKHAPSLAIAGRPSNAHPTPIQPRSHLHHAHHCGRACGERVKGTPSLTCTTPTTVAVRVGWPASARKRSAAAAQLGERKGGRPPPPAPPPPLPSSRDGWWCCLWAAASSACSKLASHPLGGTQPSSRRAHSAWRRMCGEEGHAPSQPVSHELVEVGVGHRAGPDPCQRHTSVMRR